MALRWLFCFQQGTHPNGTKFLYCSYHAQPVVVEMVSRIHRTLDCFYPGNPVNWFIVDSLRQIVMEKDFNHPEFVLDDKLTRLKRFFNSECHELPPELKSEQDVLDIPECELLAFILINDEHKLRSRIYHLVLDHLKQAAANHDSLH